MGGQTNRQTDRLSERFVSRVRRKVAACPSPDLAGNLLLVVMDRQVEDNVVYHQK